MSIFRPSNLNKRLTGTQKTATGGSPGNGGQIGPTKTPYCIKGVYNETAMLGKRYFGGGSACCGIFKINESFCGSVEKCQIRVNDLGGFLICQSGGVRWTVAPSTSEVSRTWALSSNANTVAQQVTGCTGWFIPTYTQLINPGYACRTYWDSISPFQYYWSSSDAFGDRAWSLNMCFGPAGPGDQSYENSTLCARSFRCITY